jgi:hypothetical protein
MKKQDNDKSTKFAIANGFAIGHIPETLNLVDKNDETRTRHIERQPKNVLILGDPNLNVGYVPCMWTQQKFVTQIALISSNLNAI